MNENPRFQVGQNVKIVGSTKVGTVNKIIPKPSGFGYKVMVDGSVSSYPEKYLEIFIDEEEKVMDDYKMANFGDANDLMLFETWFRLKKPIEGNLYSYLGSRTLFNPYQFKPLLKFISASSEERLFIADEVGVGKTIETGILLMELLARGRIERNQPVLIVCPNVLGPKWQKEMDKRFNFQFVLHDSKSLENMFKTLRDTNKHTQYPWGIASLQLMRTPRFMRLLEEYASSKVEPLWSLVIIDEAHHLRNSGTESNSLGHLLSSLTQMMVMLSATPLNLRDEDLYNQMSILNPALFPDIQTFQALISPVKSLNRMRRLLSNVDSVSVSDFHQELHHLSQDAMGRTIRNHPGIQSLEKRLLMSTPLESAEIAHFDRILSTLSPLDSSFTRTLKRESMDHRVTREVLQVPVKLTEREYAFYVSTIQALQEAYLYRGGNEAALGFVTNMPMRMLTSSIPAMKDYLDWALLNNKSIEDNPFDEDDENENVETDLSPELRTLFLKLREECKELAHEDSKFAAFEKLVKTMMEGLDNKQIIVFSFFRRTLKYLKERLSHLGYRVAVISGEIPLTTENGVTGRYEIMEMFENGELDILLSSEVGGEGLDFQFCQAMINYDMPYNPMRVEQRIGRLDRFGQQSDKVHIASLYLQDTVDEKIYDLLYSRIHLIEDSVGFLEPIIGTQLTDLQKAIIENSLTSDQIEVRMREIEIAMQQAKFEQDKFEHSRNELLGDDTFTQTIANMATTDFVKPLDSMKLTKLFLTESEDCDYQEIDADCCEISLSPALKLEVQEYTKEPNSGGSIQELAPLLTSKKSHQVVFNGQKSLELPKAVFLPPSGHWMKFILKKLEQSSRIRKVFNVSGLSSAFNLAPGKYFVPFFEVNFSGFRTELYLAAVPLSLEQKTTHDVDYVKFMRTIGQNAIGKEEYELLADVEELIEEARTKLEQQMEIKLESITAEHMYISESRINSLRKGFEVRQDRLKKRIDNHISTALKEGKSPSDEYLRMAHGQIENDAVRTEERISKIKERNDLILNITIVGICLLNITGDI